MMNPLCFVIMPFNKKTDSKGNIIDFNLVYHSFIRIAIENAGMTPIRADEETVNGIIHKPMYERLILCDYAVADLTTANANVLYELGIRHAVKPYTTISVFASNTILPFDVNSIRCLPYQYDTEKLLTNVEGDIAALSKQLSNAVKNKNTDSPVYQLVEGISFQNSVAHQKTDIFREQVQYNKELKDMLFDLRNSDTKKEEKIQHLKKFQQQKIDIDNEEAGVLIDLMLSYRSLNAFHEMIDLIGLLPDHLKNTVMVQEQLGFALNRIGNSEKAIQVLEKVVELHGPSSETYGILGRVYKDKYDKAVQEGNEIRAAAFLDKAITTYQKGFEADWRDAYPGINLLTLLTLKGATKEIDETAPVVAYSVRRKLTAKTPDYWDYATLLEIAVIANDKVDAMEQLSKAMACPIESWMLETTMKNLRLILEAREKRNEDVQLVKKIIEGLKC